MDLFLYNPTYQVWICTAPRCRYAVTPQLLLTHLRTHHSAHATAATPALHEAALTAMLQQPWIDPAREPCRQPSAGDPPVPGLPVYRGYKCPHCPYVARHPKVVQNHRSRNHHKQDGLQAPGRQSAAQRQARARAYLANRVINCQQLYTFGHRSYFFKVAGTLLPGEQGLVPSPLPRTSKTPAELIRAHVDQALHETEAAAEMEDGQVPAIDPHPTKASPWLELTRWPEYLRGQDLTAVALLGCLPNPQTEPLLAQFTASVQRLIDHAYQAIRGGQINEFDQ
ncbi:hypothetical protein BDW62DRAFT_207176, partial [Aspergillus aurantiobrunneus]